MYHGRDRRGGKNAKGEGVKACEIMLIKQSLSWKNTAKAITDRPNLYTGAECNAPRLVGDTGDGILRLTAYPPQGSFQ